MALAGVVALDAMRLLLADEQLALRDRQLVGRPVIRAVKTRVPLPLHAGEQSLKGGPVTTAAFPVNHSA